MKYTNIKKLLIKFMGGGLINFPTRFLRWVKIDGDTEGDDSGGDGGGDSAEIDYEAIYQFYKEEITKILPPPLLQESIIPEHFIDIVDGTGGFAEYKNKYGIWKGEPGESDTPMFADFSNTPDTTQIYFGEYNLTGSGPNGPS